MAKNPIFIEYYSHDGCDGCDCYKVRNPWPSFAEETIVLCPVSDGYEVAAKKAREALMGAMDDALAAPAPTALPTDTGSIRLEKSAKAGEEAKTYEGQPCAKPEVGKPFRLKDLEL